MGRAGSILLLGAFLSYDKAMTTATLVSVEEYLATSFPDGDRDYLEGQILELLGLSSRVKFPVKRLVPLWRNENWKPMITEWCKFALGLATFNISTFEWMASCRIDDVSGLTR